jgi:hypothetical protein
MNAFDVLLGSMMVAGLALPLLVLPWWLLSFRTRLAAPRCDRCLHRLGESGIPTIAACPECGRDLDRNGVRYGRRSPRWWWAIGFPVATLGSLQGLAMLSTVQIAGTAPPTPTPVATVDELVERLRALGSTRTADDVWALNSAVGIGLIRSLPPEWLASRRGDLADAFLAILGPPGQPDALEGASDLARALLDGEHAAEELGPDRIRELTRRYAPDPSVRVRRRQPLGAGRLELEVSMIPGLTAASASTNELTVDIGRHAIVLADGRRIEWLETLGLRLALMPGQGRDTVSMARLFPPGSPSPPPGPATVEVEWTVDRQLFPTDSPTPFSRRETTSIPIEFVAPGEPLAVVVDDPARDPIRPWLFEMVVEPLGVRVPRPLVAYEVGDRLILDSPTGYGFATEPHATIDRVRNPPPAWSGRWTVRTPGGERPIALPETGVGLDDRGTGWSAFLDRDAIAADGTITLTFTPDVAAAIEADPFADEVWGCPMTYTLPVEQKTLRWDGPPRPPRVITFPPP